MDNSFLTRKKNKSGTKRNLVYSLSDLAEAVNKNVHTLSLLSHKYPLPKPIFINRKKGHEIKIYSKKELLNWYASLPLDSV